MTSPARRRSRRLALRASAALVDRIRPVAPPAVWSALRLARSLAGSGPLVADPPAGRVLVLAPHPDDETIGCGGTVAGLAEAGSEVRVVVVTAGEASVADYSAGAAATASSRREEAAAACRALGLPPPVVLDFPDGAVAEHQSRLSARLEEETARFRPDLVFAPWPLDGHPDHRTVTAALSDVHLPAATRVWGYEVWTPLPANRVVDVTRRWRAKSAALACHASAHHSFDPSAHLALSRWRSLFGLEGQGYAEAFVVLDPPTLRQLITGL